MLTIDPQQVREWEVEWERRYAHRWHIVDGKYYPSKRTNEARSAERDRSATLQRLALLERARIELDRERLLPEATD